MRTAIAVVLSIIYLLLYGLLILQSVHGAQSLPAWATVYFVVALAATWVARRRLPTWGLASPRWGVRDRGTRAALGDPRCGELDRAT